MRGALSRSRNRPRGVGIGQDATPALAGKLTRDPGLLSAEFYLTLTPARRPGERVKAEVSLGPSPPKHPERPRTLLMDLLLLLLAIVLSIALSIGIGKGLLSLLLRLLQSHSS